MNKKLEEIKEAFERVTGISPVTKIQSSLSGPELYVWGQDEESISIGFFRFTEETIDKFFETADFDEESGLLTLTF